MPPPGPAAARRELAAARKMRERADPRWRRAVVAALNAGLGAAEVAELAGCSRQWVYEVKDQLSSRLDRHHR